MDAENREDCIYFARLSEQGERYEDMINYMKKVCKVSSSHSLFYDSEKRSRRPGSVSGSGSFILR